MKTQIDKLLQFSIVISICGNAGSPLHVYETLLANGHIEKALQAPVGGFTIPTGMVVHSSIKDSKMLASVEMLRIMFDQMATKYYKAVVSEGSDLLDYCRIVKSISSVSELDIDDLSKKLNRAKTSFRNVDDNMIFLQGEVHILIGTVTKRIKELKDEIQQNQAEHETVDMKIMLLEEEILDNEKSSQIYDRKAWDMESHARTMEREADSATVWGALELVGAAAGAAAITYFTAGLGYLVVPGVIGSFGAKNLLSAADYWSEANNFKAMAQMSRTRAHDLRYKVERSKRSKIDMKLEAENIQRQILQLEDSLRRVKELSQSLHRSVGATNEILTMLQDTVVSVVHAELDAKSLKDWFKHLPQVINKASASLLRTTQSAWTSIRELLKIHHKLLT